MLDIFIESLLDTLKIFPFLFLLYILIEVLEHKTKMGKPSRLLTGKGAPLFGCAAGLVPMCGFSVMAAKLYERKFLTVGTLFAVFIATSDEAFFVLALSSMPVLDKVITLSLLCAGKLVLGMGVGYLLDVIRKQKPQPLQNVEHHHEHDHEHHHEEPHVCEHKHESNLHLYLLSPVLHALQISGVVLLCNLAFGFLIFWIGEENFVGFIQGAGLWYQPIFCSLVGLIPNCASSVVLAETYALGGIAFGSLFGGLVTNAGLGMLVLFKNRSKVKQNFAILGATYLLGVVSGYFVNLVALVL